MHKITNNNIANIWIMANVTEKRLPTNEKVVVLTWFRYISVIKWIAFAKLIAPPIIKAGTNKIIKFAALAAPHPPLELLLKWA